MSGEKLYHSIRWNVGNFDPRAKLDSDVHKLLTKKFGELVVYPMPINRSVKHREATVYSRTIFEHAPGKPAAEQFLAVARETIERVVVAEKSRARSQRGARLEANRG